MNQHPIDQHFSKLNKNYFNYYDAEAMQRLNAFERQFIQNGIDLLKQKNTIDVLDIGIGPGRILSVHADRKNANLFGMDISNEMIQATKETLKAKERTATLAQGNFSEGLAFGNQTFDIISAIRCLKYNANWKDILRNINQRHNTDGVLIFTMVNTYFIGNILSFLKRNVKEYPVTKKEIETELHSLGYDIVSFQQKGIVPLKFYRACNGPISANLLEGWERFLSHIPLINQCAQFFYIVCRKQ